MSFLSLRVAVCLWLGSTVAQGAIVGGVEVTGLDPVSSVTAALISRQGWICTGTLVAVDIMITAAHCVEGLPSNLVVVFSRDVDSAAAVSREVVNYKTTDIWSGDFARGADQGDIAVVRFRGGLPSGYKAATLLPPGQKLIKGQSVLLAGYGVTGMTQAAQNSSGVLRKVMVKIAGFLGKTEIILDQRQGRGACHGDSGGPAFVMSGSQLLVWGVTNRGYPDSAPDDCKQMSIYTQMNAYRTWISQTITALRR